MSRGLRRQAPALIVAGLALVAAMGGTVYAAKKIDGRTIKAKSLPGNRLAIGSVPGNRLKPGTIQASQLAPGSITGIHVDASTLGQVPSAVHAEQAHSAKDAETALNAVNAQTAKSLNGYEAGCETGTRLFAGACWQEEASGSSLTAPAAAASCTSQGGELPDALSLAAFSQQPGVSLDGGGEWTGDLTNVSGADLYAAVTVSPSAVVNSAVSSTTRKFRCVIPLVR
jgi:hypothetical protein